VLPGGTGRRTNILVILVDQMRFPRWFSEAPTGFGLAPNLARLRDGAVSFAGHYTAANHCTPARSALVTGLYTHQTGCLLTGASIDLLPAGQQSELYDYTTRGGRLELENSVTMSRLTEGLDARLLTAFATELRAPLPQRLVAARTAGISDYLNTAKVVALDETARRRRRRVAQHTLPPLFA
jgi:hypothetical protein